jgi:hypothetical protein
MTENVSTTEDRQNVPPWKRLIVIGASFGVAFALALSVIVGGIVWYSSRPKPWKTDAIKARFASFEYTSQLDNLPIDFEYDLENKTDATYMVGEGSGLVVMARLAEGNVLSKDFGHYQASDASVSGPSFIPAKCVGRITVRVVYNYRSDLTKTDRSDESKVAAYVGHRVKEMSGFVLFDQSNHYRIDLPGGWQNIPK